MLAQLTFSNIAKRDVTDLSDPVMRARSKVLAGLAEQRLSVQSTIEKKPFTTTRRVGGEDRPRKFRPWWFRSAGQFYTHLCYSTSPLTFPGGSKSVEAGPTLDKLLEAFDHLKAAIEAGELDKVILEAASKRGRKGKDKAAQPASQQPAEAPSKPAEGSTKPAQAVGISGSARARNRG